MTQAALFEPDKSESLGKVWGIDPGTAALALAMHDGLHYVAELTKLPRSSDPLRRLAASIPAMRRHMENWAYLYGAPSLVMIEQPAGTGHNVHPATWYITGATAIAVAETVDCPIQMVGPPTWKSEALGKGHGHASKLQVQAWVRAQDYEPGSEHEADACGLARCGYHRLARSLPG